VIQLEGTGTRVVQLVVVLQRELHVQNSASNIVSVVELPGLFVQQALFALITYPHHQLQMQWESVKRLLANFIYGIFI
jgi:hypothetical protein